MVPRQDHCLLSVHTRPQDAHVRLQQVNFTLQLSLFSDSKTYAHAQAKIFSIFAEYFAEALQISAAFILF